MNLKDLVPTTTLDALNRFGLHKVAGVMNGVDDLNMGAAVSLIGARAYLRRKEAQAIVDGLVAYGEVTGEKVAENPLLAAMLRRAVVPAIAGAGIAALPSLMSNNPHEPSAMPAMLAGGAIGGVGGSLSALGLATKGPLGHQVANAVNGLPRMF